MLSNERSLVVTDRALVSHSWVVSRIRRTAAVEARHTKVAALDTNPGLAAVEVGESSHRVADSARSLAAAAAPADIRQVAAVADIPAEALTDTAPRRRWQRPSQRVLAYVVLDA